MPDRPNILLVTSDQHHRFALGVENPGLHTPALDSLAAHGLRAVRAYAASPVCSPSRASIITGRYPSSHGCWTIGVRLPDDSGLIEHSLPARLGVAGYATSLIGKAHFEPLEATAQSPSLESYPTLRDLDFWRSFRGPYYGFDHVELCRNHTDESHVGEHYAAWMEDQGLTDWRDYFQPWPAEPGAAPRSRPDDRWSLPVEYHYSTWIADRTIAMIDKAVAEDRPFFTWASFPDPHPPYRVPEPYASMYDPGSIDLTALGGGEPDDDELVRMAPWARLAQQDSPDFSSWQETPFLNHGFEPQHLDEKTLRRNVATYYGMLSLLDDQLQRILDRLEQLGQADNTIVVFTTDHGHYLGQHGLTAKGAFHYEDLISIPFLVRWPGVIRPGTVSDALVSHVDIEPTLLRAAGVPVPPVVQGVDQLPVWLGDTDRARGSLFVENRHQPTRVHLRTYVEQRYKMTRFRGEPWGELYDLVEDPGERHNRYDDPAAAGLRSEVALRWIDAELSRESSPNERVAVA